MSHRHSLLLGATDYGPKLAVGGEWTNGSRCNRETMERWKTRQQRDHCSAPSSAHPKGQGDVGEHFGGLLWDLDVCQGRSRHDILPDQVSLWGTGQRHWRCGTSGRKSTSWVGIITLGDIDEGVLFMVISTSPYIVGEGENMREEILARVV